MGKDQQCIEFLQWALPRLHLRWEGFRKVRSQPCKKMIRRNLAAMYFDEELQREVFGRIRKKLSKGSFLVLGKHGKPPEGLEGFDPWNGHKRIFRTRPG